MTTLFRGGVSDWIRGSQSIIHEWRMLSQSIAQTLVIGFILLLVSVFWFAWAEMTIQERHTIKTYAEASFNIAVLSDPTKLVEYRDETNQKWLVKSGQFAESRMVKAALDSMLGGAFKGAIVGFGAMAFIVAGLVSFFYFTGRNQSKEEYIRGARVGNVTGLNRSLSREGKAGVMKIGNVTIPRSFEVQHSLFLGAPGVGKTQQIMRVLEGIRAAGQRAIVYDVNGAFVEKFYREDKDIVLNPLDRRSPAWTIWNEVRIDTDYDRLAASLIPEQDTTDKFWAHAPQTVFKAIAKKIAATAHANGETPTNSALVDVTMKTTLKQLAAFCKETEAVSIIDEDGERMTASVRATLASYLKGFAVLPDEGPRFSIREFIEDERHDSWLFITSKNDQLAALRPLITLWVDTAAVSVLSLPENLDRRIWLLFDELTTLNRLASIHQMLAQARKFGGCAALSFQSFAQLQSTYGREGAEALAGNCSTWALFRANDPMSAEWCSSSLGKTERSEANEGLTVGRHEMRDGRTLNKQRVERAAVMPAELRNLENLELFLSLGRGYPIVRQRIEFRGYHTIAEAFLARDPDVKRRTDELRREAEREATLANDRARVDTLNTVAERTQRADKKTATSTPDKRPTSAGEGRQMNILDELSQESTADDSKRDSPAAAG